MENGLYFPEEDTERGVENEIPGLDYLEDASRSVELVREEGRDGQLGSFGFTLIQEKPPRVGTVIPGKPNYYLLHDWVSGRVIFFLTVQMTKICVHAKCTNEWPRD